MRSAPSFLLRWFQAPSDLELSVLYMLLGIYLSVATDAVIPFCWVTFTIVSLGCVILVLLCRLIIFFILVLGAGIHKKSWTRWGQLGFIALTTILLFWTNFGLDVRLKISESYLLKETDKVFSMPVDTQKRLYETAPLKVGLFSIRIYKVDAVKRTIWFHTEDGEALFWVPSLMGGIVYCEQGQPEEIGETSYQHLCGPWWRWAQDI